MAQREEQPRVERRRCHKREVMKPDLKVIERKTSAILVAKQDIYGDPRT